MNTEKLKAAAEKAKLESKDEWGYDTDAFHDDATPETILALLAEREADKARIAEQNTELFKQSADIAELTLSRKNAWRQASAARKGFDEQFALREAAEKRIAELEQQAIQPLPIGELLKRLEDQTGEPWGEAYLAGIKHARRFEINPGTHEMIDLKERIAELEARTLRVQLPPLASADKYVDEVFDNSDLASIYNACRLECEVKIKNACAAAGITLETGE